MAKKLWFLTDGVKIVDVFQEKHEVESSYKTFQDDPDFNYYDFYGIEINDLEDYPEEYDYAIGEGFI